MGSLQIQERIKAGLARAVLKTGSPTADKVFLITKTNTGTATEKGIITETPTLLLNAIFVSYNINLIGANIQIGDRELISDSDVTIPSGSTIRQGLTDYIVIGPSPVAPTSDVLVYRTQVRVK